MKYSQRIILLVLLHEKRIKFCQRGKEEEKRSKQSSYEAKKAFKKLRETKK